MSEYTKEAVVGHMRKWYFAHYEPIEESTPRDSGEWVFIHGEPISPQEALEDQFGGLFDEVLISKVADQLVEEFDIDEWVPVPD